MTTTDELKSLVKEQKDSTQTVYNIIGERILQEAKRLISEGKVDEDGYIHVEDAGLYESGAEYVQGEWDGQMMEWIYLDDEGLNFGNGYGDWTIEDFDFDLFDSQTTAFSNDLTTISCDVIGG